jgi:transposase-like protein
MAQHVRDLRLERYWRDHVERRRQSGLTVRVYCQRHNLKEPAFYHWQRTIAERDRAVQPATPDTQSPSAAFVPVTIVERAPIAPAQSAESPIEICLRHGRRVRVRAGCDRQLLACVIALLEGQRC